MTIIGKQNLNKERKTNDWIPTIICLAMIAGFLWSRALLSTSIIFLFSYSIFFSNLKEQFANWKKDQFAIACFLFFLANFISVFWSENKSDWWIEIINKIPFIVLPFAFFSIPLPKIKFRKVIIIGLLLMQTAVIIHSLTAFFMDSQFYIESYHYMKTLPTTKYNDHIRFSLSLVLSLLLIFQQLFEKKNSLFIALKSFYIFTGVVFIVYLHILAAKSGLLALYLMIPLFILLKYFRKNKALTISIIAGITLLPFIAFYTIPTFQKKIRNVQYEYNTAIEESELNYTRSDQGRLISYQMAWKALKKNTFLGVGLGDIRQEMNEYYSQFRPDIPQERRLIPHNQFLFTALSVGLFLFLSLIWMLWSATSKIRFQRIYPLIASIVMTTAFMTEAMLEIQFGIFVYLFYSLFWRHINRQFEIVQKNAN